MRALPGLLLLVACGGPMRAYPRWTFDGETRHRDACLDAEAFIRVSGKTGVGVTVALRSHATCPVRITRAELVLDGERVAAELPAPQTLPGRSLTYVWLPFAFDNNQAWNDDRRRGRFEIDVAVGEAPPTPWVIAAHHAFVDGRWAGGGR